MVPGWHAVHWWQLWQCHCRQMLQGLGKIQKLPPILITRHLSPKVCGKVYIDGLVQDCSNSSVLAMELLQSCTKPSTWPVSIRLCSTVAKCGDQMLLTYTVFPKSRQHVCFVRRRIQMSDVEFVKIISIWCLSVQFGRRNMESIREDCLQRLFPNDRCTICWICGTKDHDETPSTSLLPKVRIEDTTAVQRLGYSLDM